MLIFTVFFAGSNCFEALYIFGLKVGWDYDDQIHNKRRARKLLVFSPLSRRMQNKVISNQNFS